MRWLKRILLSLVVLYASLLAGLLAVMRQPTVFGKVMSKMPEALFFVVPFKQLWFLARAGHLKVGDPAPDFTLSSSNKKSTVRLSAFRGHKLVVLVFGSYT